MYTASFYRIHMSTCRKHSQADIPSGLLSKTAKPLLPGSDTNTDSSLFLFPARWFQLCMSAWYAWFFINYSLSFFCFSDFYQKVLHILHRTIGWAVFAYTKGAPDMHLYAHKNKKSRGFLLGSWHLSDVLLWFLQLSRNGLLSSTVLHVLLYHDELL